MTSSRQIAIIDDSLSIINRTGAYQIAKDLTQEFSPPLRVRRWRLGSRLPQGIERKIAARAMMQEYLRLSDSDLFRIRRKGAVGTLFLDPLYTLRADLKADDIVLCHDIGPVSHPWLYHDNTVALYEKAYALIARIKPRMVFVSQWSMAEFTLRFGKDFPMLRTIPLYLRAGISDGKSPPSVAMPDRFFLTVGALEVRKNTIAAIEAYAGGGFHEKGIGYVVCGARGDDAERITKLCERTPGVRLLGYVSDAELNWLYDHAEAFLLPSHLEGFGMPALEAIARGLLPIISARSALVEAAKDHGIEVDPASQEDIAAGMQAAIDRPHEMRATQKAAMQEDAACETRDRFVADWRHTLQECGFLP